jgi:hypothetical protein
MEVNMERRTFLKIGVTGAAALSLLPLVNRGRWGAVDLNMSLSIEGALFEMIDGTFVFMWAFRDPQADAPRMPGPGGPGGYLDH